MSRSVLWPRLFCAGLVAVLIGGAMYVEASADRFEGLGLGQHPPQFSVKDLSGKKQNLKRHEGKVLVLHFWATWCPYCRGEIPKLLTIYNDMAAKGVSILTISTDQDIGTLERFIEQKDIPYPVISDAKNDFSLSGKYQVRGIPVTFIMAPDGRIAYSLQGQSDIVGAVERTLAQSSRSTD